MYSFQTSSVIALLCAVFYQWWLKDIFFVRLGIARVVEPIENFPYKCRRLEHQKLQACGDMWLDDSTRVLYTACTGLTVRNEWNPNFERFNVSGRRPGGSDIMAIYIDSPKKDGSFKMHRIQPTGYGNTPGDGQLDLSGFDVERLFDMNIIRFWLLNQRPFYDTNGKPDASKNGANITIDVYEYKRGEKRMTHIANSWSPMLHSANKILFMGANNFAVSNDRSGQIGLRKKLDSVLGGGSLVYYDDWFDQYKITPKTLPLPGQMMRGSDDRLYVPSLVDDRIRVFELQEDRTYKQVHTIKIGMPIASLSIDSKEDIWAIGRNKYDYTGLKSTNAIFKIKKIDDKLPIRYVTTKVLEDKEREFISGASVVRHDPKSNRIFLSGAYSSGITVCDPQ